MNPTPLQFSQASLIALAQSAGLPSNEFAPLLEELRVAPFASVRFRAAESELAEAITTGNVASVVDLVAALIAALIGSREERDSGRPLWEPKPRIETDSLITAREWVDPDFWILQLCNALLALVAVGSRIGSSVATWEAQAKAARAPAAVREWIHSVEQLAARDERAWLSALRNASEHWSERIVAAALILGTEAPDARLMVHAHVTLLELHKWSLASQFESGVCRAVSHAWRQQATQRSFSLRAPRLNVPSIMEACDDTGHSWAKAARILLAAAPAVDILVPEPIISEARQLSEELEADR